MSAAKSFFVALLLAVVAALATITQATNECVDGKEVSITMSSSPSYPTTVKSDDGGTAGQYAQKNTGCKWLLTCETNHYPYLKVSTHFESTATLKVGRASGVSSALLTFGATDMTEQGYMFGNTPETLALLFQATSVGTTHGFTAYLNCMDKKCSLTKITPWEIYSGASATVKNTDKYANGEVCDFVFDCNDISANDDKVARVEYTVISTDPNDSLKIEQNGSEVVPAVTASTTAPSPTTTSPSNTVTLTWTTDFEQQANDGGFKATISCVDPPGKCLPLMGSETTVTITPSQAKLSPGVEIKSDEDGFGIGLYEISQDCQWELNCGAGYYAMIKGLQSGLQPGASLLVKEASDANKNLLRLSDTDEPDSPNYTFQEDKSKLFIQFETTARKPVSSGVSHVGFTATVKCLRSNDCDPSALVEVTTLGLVRYPHTAKSHVDGLAGSYKANDGSGGCKWELTCSTGRSPHLLVNADLETTSALTVKRSQGDQKAALQFTGTTAVSKQSYVFGSTPTTLYLHFEASADSPSGTTKGFTAKLDCMATQCSLPQEENVMEIYSGETSDTDLQLATTKYTNGEECVFWFECDTDEVAQVTYTVVSKDPKDILKIEQQNGADLSGSPVTASTTGTSTAKSPDKYVTLKWTTNFEQSGGNVGGFKASITCLDPPDDSGNDDDGGGDGVEKVDDGDASPSAVPVLVSVFLAAVLALLA